MHVHYTSCCLLSLFIRLNNLAEKMSRVWSSRATMSENKLKVKLGSEISPSKLYSEGTEASTTFVTGRKRRSSRRGASPAVSDSSRSPTPKRGRTQEKKKKGTAKKGRKRSRSSSSSSLSSLSSVSRSRSRSSSSEGKNVTVPGE